MFKALDSCLHLNLSSLQDTFIRVGSYSSSLFWQEVETYFFEGLRKWKELNLTQHFGMSLIFTFPAFLELIKYVSSSSGAQWEIVDCFLDWDLEHYYSLTPYMFTRDWTGFQGFSFVVWTVKFYNEVANKCQSFNQLVYYQSAVVQSLKTHLQVEGSLAYQPLLK